MANRAFSRLIAMVTPSSGNYFVLFNELATCSVRGAKELARMSAVNDPVAFEQHFQNIRRIESEADEITKTILLSLHKTFITPFDRSEIKDLAMALDDMIDYMEDIPQRAELYGPGEFTPEMSTLGQIAVRATEKIQEAVAMLEDMKNAERILKICQEIGEIEGEADRIMRAGMTRLFAEVSDARALIRAKELYELFEGAVDRCEDAADVIHGVVLERI
ncbi:MAG: phosphate transport regulator [Gallionellales bacterium RIFCSPLOWO2_12_FULL_59_22]|nr:MAG: phosphate transport regulator [Gallionellales bacterium RIFCSPLOWO2_02_58_13]OGT12443.1 MAG: phosphate transport regulator [Gallionellales bacterium RIFCSPLOWO2_12_FULL_59_22]